MFTKLIPVVLSAVFLMPSAAEAKYVKYGKYTGAFPFNSRSGGAYFPVAGTSRTNIKELPFTVGPKNLVMVSYDALCKITSDTPGLAVLDVRFAFDADFSETFPAQNTDATFCGVWNDGEGSDEISVSRGSLSFVRRLPEGQHRLYLYVKARMDDGDPPRDKSVTGTLGMSTIIITAE